MRAAADVDAFYAARRPGQAPEDQVLMIQADGKGIVMREEGLRPATAKAAAAAKRKVAARLSPGEKNGRKRMAEIAAVTDVIPASRTPADIITPPGRDRADPPKTQGKWLTASVTDDIGTVIAAAFDEAQRRDPGRERTWIALVDGNNTQIEAITAEAERRGVTVTIGIDFIHVIEYCWRAAWTFFEPGATDAGDWVAGRATAILEGRAADVPRGTAAAPPRGDSPAERKGADTCAGYLDAKAPYLDYATALARGWPIATGIIEGACRHIIKDRFDITGARWSLDGAEALLETTSSPRQRRLRRILALAPAQGTPARLRTRRLTSSTLKEPHPLSYRNAILKNAGRPMYHTTGLTQDEISDLCAMIWQTAAETGKAAWPPRLGLYKSVVVTLSYLRRNRVQAEIAESFGVSQPTISRAISAISPLLEKVLSGIVPTADEL